MYSGRIALRSLALLLLCCVPASAQMKFDQPSPEKTCLFAAAQKVPNVPGLQIVKSRVSNAPKELKTPEAYIVEIDVKYTDQTATYVFACFSKPGVPASAQPVGMK